jgi:uncharacterized protein YjbJ (UPF0337 family)
MYRSGKLSEPRVFLGLHSGAHPRAISCAASTTSGIRSNKHRTWVMSPVEIDEVFDVRDDDDCRFTSAEEKKVTTMNKDQIKGKWNQLKGDIKKKWGKMTDDDLLEMEGDMDKLSGKIQERTGDSREDIRKWLNEHK